MVALRLIILSILCVGICGANIIWQLMFISPMEQFQIFPLFTTGSLLVLNNVIFYLFMGGFTITLLINFAGSLGGKLVGGFWFILSESLFRTIAVLVENYVGNKFFIFLPFIYTLFHLILFSNLIGLIPYSSTPTVELVITLSIAFALLLGILILGFMTHKLLLIGAFIPAGTPLSLIFLIFPLEILAYVIRTASLGLRLGVNMIAGHLLVKVIVGFIWGAYLNGTSLVILVLPLLLLTAFLALELLIAYLQAYIFTVIVCITIKDII